MRGSCNCQNVRFICFADTPRLSIFHCRHCGEQSGGVWSSAVVEETDIAMSGSLKWYQSGPEAKRGFCPECGAFLVGNREDKSAIGFALGHVGGSTGLASEKNIFVGDKGDYYQIADGVPQEEN